MANKVEELNFDEILTLIQGQLLEYMNSTDENYEKYKNTNIILSREQQFMKLKDKDPNAIYIVVKFGQADIAYGQTVLPVTLIALAEQNRLDLAYNMLYGYAQTYNLQRTEDGTINQVYESPNITGNFNVVYEGYRSVVSMSCAFVIGKNSNEYKVYYYFEEGGQLYAEEIPLVSASFGFSGSPDTQVFYNSNDYARSVVGFANISLGFSMFVLTDNRLVNDVLTVMGEVKEGGQTAIIYGSDKNEKGEVDAIITPETVIAESVDGKVNATFRFGIIYRDGKHARIRDYKLTSAVGSQEMGQIPTMALAFTE